MAAWNKDAIGQVETMGLILFGIIGRKVDGHVSANGERVEKYLFSALTSSRKRAELIEGRDIQLRPSSHVETVACLAKIQ